MARIELTMQALNLSSGERRQAVILARSRFRRCLHGSTPRQQTARQAFTLIEALVAITVLAILAAVILPTHSSNHRQSLQSLAQVLASDLRLARAQAIQTNAAWAIEFDTAENSYELLPRGSGTYSVPQNPLAPPSQQNGRYVIDLNKMGLTSEFTSGVLASAALADSRQRVTDVTFEPSGGTGPTRSEDTLIVLTQKSGSKMWSIELTVSWVTGQVWIGEPSPFITGNSIN